MDIREKIMEIKEYTEEYLKEIKRLNKLDGLNEEVSKVALMNITSGIEKFINKMIKQVAKQKQIMGMSDEEFTLIIDNHLTDIDVAMADLQTANWNLKKSIKKL